MRSRLTPEIERTILAAARLGASKRTAAGAAGIGKSTLCDWLDAGDRSPQGRYGPLARAWDRAQADRELDALRAVAKRAVNWQSGAWFLERRDPEHWARPERPHVPLVAGPLPSVVRIILPDNGRAPYPADPRQKDEDADADHE